MRLDYFIFKLISKVVLKVFPRKNEILNRETNADKSAQLIYTLLMSDKPVMIARFGSTELMCMVNYLGVKSGKPNLLKYFSGNELDWWWKDTSLNQIEQWSGFFPPTVENVERFCEMMIADSSKVDVLASWLSDEIYFKNELSNATFIQGLFLDPFWSKIPWTLALKNKKVLVIHPFQNTIISQYEKREILFQNSNLLPEFELKTIKAVQSLGGESDFSSWFEALEFMKSEITKVDFDICLIGAGAYGFPLAAYVKSLGKKAVHIGGSLQLLFGIKGKRWENPLYGIGELGEEGMYIKLMNENWIFPGDEGKPSNADKVEGACYW